MVDHLAAYAALIHQEASAAGTGLFTRLAAWLVAVLATVVFLGLAGTALMVGVLYQQFHWVLVAVPGLALLMVLVAVFQAKKPFNHERFPELKAQIDSDARALRTVA